MKEREVMGPQSRWLLYAVLIAAPALLAWEDFFYLLAFGGEEDSLLRAGTVTSIGIFTAALSLPLLYAAGLRLRDSDGGPTRQSSSITLLYLFAAVGYILDAIAFGTFHDGAGDAVLYAWAVFFMVLYLPVVTVAVTLLGDPRSPFARTFAGRTP